MIAGVGEPNWGGEPAPSEVDLQAQAAVRAIADAGLCKDEVDGIFVQNTGLERMPGLLLSEYLGIQPTVVDSTTTGGTSNLVHVMHAMAAIEAGQCEVALVAYGSTQRSSRTRAVAGWAENSSSPLGQFVVPYGYLNPIGAYAMAARRYHHLYGTGPEDLAEVAMTARRWAGLNPRAIRTEPLSLEAYLDSPMVSDPLRRADICLVTDGGGALIVCRADRSDAVSREVEIMGHGQVTRGHYWIAGLDDILDTGAAVSSSQAYARAGLGPEEIDLYQIYDAFTIMPILGVEDMGLCARGEGTTFFVGGRTGPGGPAPTNTSGGGLAYCHPGMFGIFLLIEAVQQLRGEAGARQVQGVATAACQAFGGQWSSAATLVLGRS